MQFGLYLGSGDLWQILYTVTFKYFDIFEHIVLWGYDFMTDRIIIEAYSNIHKTSLVALDLMNAQHLYTTLQN